MSNPFKPDWKDAPEWARYLTRDTDGTWRWFEYKPVREDYGFTNSGAGGKWDEADTLTPYLESKPQEYALYKGEELLAVGTIAEIAEQMGVNEKSIAYYLTESYQKRLKARKRSKNTRVLEPLDADEEDDLLE